MELAAVAVEKTEETVVVVGEVVVADVVFGVVVVVVGVNVFHDTNQVLKMSVQASVVGVGTSVVVESAFGVGVGVGCLGEYNVVSDAFL